MYTTLIFADIYFFLASKKDVISVLALPYVQWSPHDHVDSFSFRKNGNYPQKEKMLNWLSAKAEKEGDREREHSYLFHKWKISVRIAWFPLLRSCFLPDFVLTTGRMPF